MTGSPSFKSYAQSWSNYNTESYHYLIRRQSNFHLSKSKKYQNAKKENKWIQQMQNFSINTINF